MYTWRPQTPEQERHLGGQQETKLEGTPRTRVQRVSEVSGVHERHLRALSSCARQRERSA